MPIYASAPFLKAVGDESGWLGGFDRQDKKCCILPYTIIRKASVHMARFRVETIPTADELSQENEKSFLNGVVAHLRREGIDMIVPASTNAIFRTFPDRAEAAPYGSHILDLSQPEESLWGAVHPKHKNVIRSAAKKGVEVRSGPDLADKAYELIRATFKRSAMPFMGRDSFLKYVHALGSNVMVLTAQAGGEVQACAVVPFSEFGAYYAYGGTAANPTTGASNLLQWHAIQHFKSIGVKRYDFCGARIDPAPGSKAAGLIMFKERFGASLRRGYMWKHAIKPWKAAIYSLAIRLRRGGDIVDAEKHKLAAASSPADPLVATSVQAAHD
jgi:hypothetical protein